MRVLTNPIPFVNGTAAGAAFAASGTTYFNPFSTAFITSSATEANREGKTMYAGVLSDYNIRIITASTTNSTLVSRKSTVTQNASITLPANTTGIFSDRNARDTIASGEFWAIQVTTGTGGLTATAFSVCYRPSSNTQSFIASQSTADLSGATTNYRLAWGGAMNSGASLTEVQANLDVGVAGTFKNIYAYVPINTKGFNVTYRLRKNTANGNLVFTIPALTTGFYEDNANSDTVVAGDDVCNSRVASSGTGSYSVAQSGITFETTTGHSLFNAGIVSGTVVNQALTRYINLGGYPTVNATETSASINLNTAGVLSKGCVNMRTNTVTATSTLRTRKNAANGNISISITASTTGQFLDGSNSDVYSESDLLCWQLVAGTGGTSMSIGGISLVNLRNQAIMEPIVFAKQAINRARTY